MTGSDQSGYRASASFYVLPRYYCLASSATVGFDQVILLCTLLGIIGLGVNFIAIPLSAEISFAIEAKEKDQPRIYGSRGAYAQGYALLNMGFATGALVGPLWAGYMMTEKGWSTLGWRVWERCVLSW
jgi:MFS family permease